MQTINARIFGRHIDIDSTSIMLGDDKALAIHFIWPEETSTLSKVVHCELPGGYKFEQVLDGDDFVITHEMTAKPGKMSLNVSFISGDVEKWSTFDKVIDIYARVDATGHELERTEPNVIDSIIAHDTRQDERLASLESGSSGEVTHAYVDAKDAETLEAAKAYADTLPGPQGPQGVPGVDGAQGPAGKDGVDGLTTIAAATDFFRGSQTAYDALTVEQKSAIMLAVVV